MEQTAVLPRPAERTAIVSLVLVFLCGCVAGALLMSVLGHSAVKPSKGTVPASFTIAASEWKEELNLTDDQTQQLMSILDDFSHYYDNVLADGNSRIMAILTPEQRQRFQQLLKKRHR